MTDADHEREFEDVLQHLARFPGVTAPAGLEDRVLKSMKSPRPEAAVEVADLAVVLSCTFCHDRLAREEAAYCATCLAPHHEDCFSSHGRCAIPGCDEVELVEPRRAKARRTGLRRWRWGLPAVLVGTAAFGLTAAWQQRAPEKVALETPPQPEVNEEQALGTKGGQLQLELDEVDRLLSKLEESGASEGEDPTGTLERIRAVCDRASQGASPQLKDRAQRLRGRLTKLTRAWDAIPKPPKTSHLEVRLGEVISGHLEAGAASPWLRLRRPARAGKSFALFLEAPEDATFSLAVHDGTEQTPPVNPDPGRAQAGSGRMVWSINAFDPFMWIRVEAVKGMGGFRVLAVEDMVTAGREGLNLAATAKLGERIAGVVPQSGAVWVAIETGGAKPLTLTLLGPEGADQDVLVLLGKAKGPFLTSVFWCQLGEGSGNSLTVEYGSELLYVRVFGEPGPFSLEVSAE